MSLTPESVFMSLYQLSDHTIPRSYRMIQGFGVNTFVLVNKEGTRTFVKYVALTLSSSLLSLLRMTFLTRPLALLLLSLLPHRYHWRPHLGAHGLVWDEALKLGGQDPDYLRRDLADAIEAGAYPKYELGVQLITEEQELGFSFDILDCTKVVPEDLVPIKWVGTMTLNRNPTKCVLSLSFSLSFYSSTAR